MPSRTRDENEELLANMLADLEKYSGIPLADIMASEFEPTAPGTLPEGFQVEPIEEPIGIESAGRMAEPFDLENDSGRDFNDYLDDYFEDFEDIDPDADDPYDDPV